jgi:hypothetical protein
MTGNELMIIGLAVLWAQLVLLGIAMFTEKGE